MIYAGFQKRVLAMIIDGFIINIALLLVKTMAGIFFDSETIVRAAPRVVGVVVRAAVAALSRFAGIDMPINAAGGMLILGLCSLLLLTLVQWLYSALMESSARQATLGKRVVSIRVTDLAGQRVTFARATKRHFAKQISTLTLGIGFIMAGFTPKKQALHDMIAGSLVINDAAVGEFPEAAHPESAPTDSSLGSGAG